MANWQPSASIDNIRLRAELLAKVREFFRVNGVMEVETPLLCSTTATDPHLESISVSKVYSGELREFFLQTSPEFAMKKLLAAGSGCIFQICKAFRQDEGSRRHNPEFTMLEWYRVGSDEHQLMDEVAELVEVVTGRLVAERLTYRELFQQHLAIDPHSCTRVQLLETANRHINFNNAGYTHDELLHLLLSEVIEPALNQDCFVYDFPANMAALAATGEDVQGVTIARRFELFMDGMEIANGYFELADASIQQRRFESDLEQRRAKQRRDLPIDFDLIAALEKGLPSCSGVALGVDRLLMLASGANSIDRVISFNLPRVTN